MNRVKLLTSGLVMLVATSAWANDEMGQPPDMSKMGPWTRTPTNVEKTKAEVRAFFARQDKLWEKRDFDAALNSVDFPIYMFTDDAKTGVPMADLWNKTMYVAQMKPSWNNTPKGMATTHQFDITVLSDTLVSYVDRFTINMGKSKMKGTSAGLLVKIKGEWKWKVMGEAGWGDMAAASAKQ